MELTIETLILLITTLGGLAGAIVGQQKYAKAKANLIETVGDIANLLAMIYAISKAGECSPENMKIITKKVEEIWQDLQDLGPSFANLLADKSALAAVLKK